MFGRFVRASFPLLIAACLSGCLQFGLPGDTDGGAAVQDAGRASDGAVAADVKTPDVGIDRGCVVDPLSHATLCTTIALCPGLAIDHDRFPNCGFRTGTGIIDIECVCDDYLCPLGTTLTCAQARDLLASQFELLACTQVSEGRCAPRRVVPPARTSCDETCATACAGAPGLIGMMSPAGQRCMRACGC